ETSLCIMMLASYESEREAHLERLAMSHSRAGFDIMPELYDLWLERLLQTVWEFDPLFDVEFNTAWRNVLQPGIDFMKSKCWRRRSS
ncbi:MAG: hypothetical protein ABIS45_06505, partial [Burkholderiales bacterium]